jgi:hypothetical protein
MAAVLPTSSNSPGPRKPSPEYSGFGNGGGFAIIVPEHRTPKPKSPIFKFSQA